MNKQNEKFRRVCVWWTCVLVASIPIIAGMWFLVMRQ